MRQFFTKKRIIWSAIGLVLIGGIAFFVIRAKLAAPGNIVIDTVKKQDLEKTVLATGAVSSSTDLDLNFKSSGIVSRIYVKVGDKVAAGRVLANLEQREQAAALTSARGALAAAQANYEKVLSGASSEEVQIAQVAVDNAKKNLEDVKAQQAVAVSNAKKTLLNSGLSAVPGSSNVSGLTATVTGAYTDTAEGSYNIRVVPGGSEPTYVVSGLENAQGTIKSNLSVPMGSKGLYIQFSSGQVYGNETWTVEIPNTKASTYVSNKTAYDAAVQNQVTAVNAAQSSYDTAVVNLNLKKALARPADVKAAQAQILSAQGQVQAASAALENTIIRAPASGTITSVDVKVGEAPQVGKPVIVLQDVESLHVETNISEANIAQVAIGQEVDITLDSFGSEKHFKGTVVGIDPASTVVSGVINYKVTTSLEKLPEIKPGMTANVNIVISKKPGVLAVPSRSVISKNGKKLVRVITDAKKKAYLETEVQLGIEADGGLVEVTSGLSEGETIVTDIK